jgi:hypothetical protein
MRVGMLGLGAPSQLLSLASASNPFINIQDTTSATGSKAGISFTMTSVSGSSGARIEVERLGASAQSSLSFYTGGTLGTNVRALTIDQFQRVGIGNTAPQRALHVSSAASEQVVLSSTSGSLAGIFFEPNGTTYTPFFGATGASLVSYTSGAERCRVDDSGRLLVGTSSARSNFFNTTVTTPFQIEGTTTTTSSISCVSNNASGNNAALILAKSNGASVGSNTLVNNGDVLGGLYIQGSDGTEFVAAAQITAEVDGTPSANDMPGRLVFSTTADGAASPTERLRITSAGVLQVADAGNITVGTTTGTKIGTATTQKLGFYNATPVVQPTAVADATDAATAITQLNDLLAKLRTLGIIAT